MITRNGVPIILLWVLLSTIVMGQDIGIRDTCRYEPAVSEWTIGSAADSMHIVELWGWSDDPMVVGASFGFKLTTSTGGGFGYEDSVLIVDTFIYDPGLSDVEIRAFKRSLLDESIDPSAQNFGCNAYLLGIIDFTFDPILDVGVPTKIGDLYVKFVETTNLPPSFEIEIDSVFFPPAGGFKYSPTGSEGFAPFFTPGVIEVTVGADTVPSIEVSAASIDFGQVLVGAMSVEELRIWNRGTQQLVIDSIYTDNAVFSPSVAILTIPPTSSVTIEIDFQPGSTGLFSGTLTIESNDPDDPVVTVDLSGQGVISPEISLDPTQFVDSLVSGDSSQHTLTIANIGDPTAADLLWELQSIVYDDSKSEFFQLTAPDPDAVPQDETSTPAGELPSFRGESLGATLGDLTGITILVDLSHGQLSSYWSTLRNDLISRGAEVVFNMNEITPSTLVTCNVLWITDLYSSFTASEVTAISDWVQGGGSLLLEGDNDASVPNYNLLLSTMEAGIVYNTLDGTDGNTTNIFPHEMTDNVTSIFLAGNISRLSAVNSPASTLIEDIAGIPNTAYAVLGNGRLLAMADEVFENSRMGSADNQLFANQAFDWLSLGLDWFRMEPMSGTVPAGSSMDVSVILNATHLYGGDYHADIIITSNDLANPTSVITADLNVTGAAHIVLSPDSLQYGDIIIGTTAIDSFMVSNEGTEPLVISNVVIDNPEYTPSVDSLTLEIAEFQYVIVEFVPANIGDRPGILTLISNDPSDPAVTVTLTGAGVMSPKISIEPTEFIDSLFTGDTSVHLMTISNTENPPAADLQWELESINYDPNKSNTYTLTLPDTSARPMGDTPAPDEAVPDFRTSAISAELKDLSGIRILYDRSHGQYSFYNWSTIISDLSSRGAEVTTSLDSLTSSALESYDVLWLTEQFYYFSTEELVAVTNWVSSGGAVLFIGDGSTSVVSFNDMLSTMGIGIVFNTTNGEDGTTANIYPHPMTSDVREIYMWNIGAHLSSVTSPASVLIEDTLGTPIVAFSSYGSGRILAISDEIFEDYYIGSTDNQLFANQAFDWLALGLGWITMAPVSGTLSAGSSTDVEVIVNATDLFGGDYHADVTITSNDVANPTPMITADLNVTSASDIVISTDMLDYGTVIIGVAATDSFIVTNDGTGPLVVSSITTDNPEFTATVDSFTLDIGDYATVTVEFAPANEGDRTATLMINSNDPDSPTLTVSLVGYGIMPPIIEVDPTEVLDSLFTDETSTHVISVANLGVADLEFDVFVEADMLRVAPLPDSLMPYVTHTEFRKGEGDEPLNEDGEMLLGGGPDAFGYKWLTSDDPGGPQLDWIDVSDGTDISLSDDDFETGIPLGFEFIYYGTPFTEIGVGSNGWLSFNGVNSWYPSTVPMVDSYAGAIAPFGRDLYPPNADYIRYKTIGTAPNRRFIVEYNNIPDCCGTSNRKTFEVVFFEKSGEILFQYLIAPNVPNGLGIESPDQSMGIGDGGLDDLYVSPYEVKDSFVIAFRLSPAWIDVSPTFGIVPQDSTAELIVDLDAYQLFGGLYAADVVISCNDPNSPENVIPVELLVTGIPNINVSTDTLDFGQVFLGFASIESLYVNNIGTDTLSVYGTTSDDPDFSVIPSNFDLLPGESQLVSVQFLPTVLGNHSSYLSISSNDPDDPELVVQLLGDVVLPPAVQVEPDEVYDSLITGDSSRHTVILSNIADPGAEDLYWHLRSISYDNPMKKVYMLSEPIEGTEPADSVSDGETDRPPARAKAMSLELEDLTGIDILFDLSHGQNFYYWSTIMSDVMHRGAIVLPNADPITPALLQDFDILWSTDLYSGFTTSEVTAIVDWIGSGGSLLLEGDDNPSVTSFNDLLAKLESGIVYSTTNGTGGFTTNIYPHETTDGISELYLTSNNARLETVEIPATLLVEDISGIPNTACSRFGYGRILAMADEVFEDYRMGIADNQMFANQAFDWLALGTGWLEIVPDSGVVAAGSSMDLYLDMDASDMFGGDYQATVLLESNDPDDSLVSLVAHLNVTGVPDIHASPDSLRFGMVFIGQSKMDSFAVANLGTDILTVKAVTCKHPDITPAAGLFSLEPGESRWVEVEYSPSADGCVEAPVVVQCNDPDEPLKSVTAFGQGMQPPVISVSPDSIEHSLFTGQIAEDRITINNRGRSRLLFEIRVDYDDPSSANNRSEEWVSAILASNESVALSSGTPVSEHADYEPVEMPPLYTADEILRMRSQTTGDPMRLVYAVVLDGIGTASPGDRLWDYLNANWANYGETEILIDYSTFHNRTIEYDDLIEAGPDVVIISNNWNPTQSYGAFSESEAQAIAEYVEDGAGFYCTGGTLNNGEYSALQYQVDYFAPLVGLDNTETYYWNSNYYEPLYFEIPDHPVLRDVTEPFISGYQSTTLIPSSGTWIDGAITVADLVAVSTNGTVAVTAFENRVYHTSLPEHYTGTNSDKQFIYNVLTLESAAGWLSLDVYSGVVGPFASTDIPVTINSLGLEGGHHRCEITVKSNDPVHPAVSVPVNLMVDGQPDIMVHEDSLNYGTVYVGTYGSRELTIENVGVEILSITSITSGNFVFSVDSSSLEVPPGETRIVTVEFAPFAASTYVSSLTVSSNDPDESIVTVSLVGEGMIPPEISIDPGMVSDSLFAGDSSVHFVTISNEASSAADDLIWRIESIEERDGNTRMYELTPPSAQSSTVDKGQGDAPDQTTRTTSITRDLADLTGVEIVFDGSHYQDISYWEIIASDLMTRGATVTENFDQITPELLEDKDVLWMTDLGSPLLASEVLAIADWVVSGGGLLLEGDNSATVPYYNDLLDEIGAGIQYTYGGAIDGVTTNIHPHETTVDVSSILLYLNYSHLSTVDAPAAVLIDDYLGTPNTAYSESGNGRIIAMADELCENFRMGLEDNQLFANQVFDWLSAGVDWITIFPDSGSVPAGASMQVEAKLVTEHLLGGMYYAHAMIESNDLDESTSELLIQLYVTGAPAITVSHDSIDFGQVYAGDTAVDSLVVGNAGTDLLTVSSAAADDPVFSIDPSSFSVQPGESQTLYASFAPVMANDYTGTLTLQSDDPDEPSYPVALLGSGIEPPDIDLSPDSLFEILVPDDTITRSITIANVGQHDLTWEIEVIEPDAERFKSAGDSAKAQQTDEAPDRMPEEADSRLPYNDGYEPSRDPIHPDDSNDSKDPNSVSVLIIYNGTLVTEFSSLLLAFPDIDQVDTYDGEYQTPALSYLLNYHAVIICNMVSFYSPTGMGDVLADYVDSGGNLILTLASFVTGWQIDGRLFYDGYMPLVDGYGPLGSSTLGTYDPSHPLMENVTTVWGDLLADAEVTPGSEVVAYWSNGFEFVATSQLGVTAVNIVLVDYGWWTGDVPQLIHNAVFLGAGPSWLSLDATSGVLPPGGSTEVQVLFDAEGLDADSFEADIVVRSDDPDEDSLGIGVLMIVVAGSALSPMHDSVEIGGVPGLVERGDFDLNGTVDIDDAVSLINCVLSNCEQLLSRQVYGDIDKDGKVTIDDATLLLRTLFGDENSSSMGDED